MLGQPKFDYGDVVSFAINAEDQQYVLKGTISVVDKWGSFGYNEDVSYDIMVQNSHLHDGVPCLYKHIPESLVVLIEKKTN